MSNWLRRICLWRFEEPRKDPETKCIVSSIDQFKDGTTTGANLIKIIKKQVNFTDEYELGTVKKGWSNASAMVHYLFTTMRHHGTPTNKDTRVVLSTSLSCGADLITKANNYHISLIALVSQAALFGECMRRDRSLDLDG